MTRFYISADLEGVGGVTNPVQCYPKEDRSGYEVAVRQLAAEVNAVAQSILESRPDAEILVNDAHSAMINLSLEPLSPKIQLLSGKPKLCAMMAGLDSGFDAAFFVGYHAKAGAEKGVLNHTYHNKLFDVSVNGTSYGEGGINALYASLVHKVPVILAGGDRAFCEEIRTVIPNVETVETKTGLTTTAARCRSSADVLEDYRAKTKRVLESPDSWRNNLLNIQAPYTLRITFTNSLACDVVVTSPLYKRLDGRTVEATVNMFQEVFQVLQAAYTMLAYTHYMDW